MGFVPTLETSAGSRLPAALATTPGGGIARIVDLGCGTGRYSEALAAHSDARVVGVDPSEKTSTSSCFGGRRRGPPRTPHGPPDDPVLASRGNQR